MGKKLGQNFLKNREKLQEITSALNIQKGDTVIEVGPGHGELTRELRIKNRELRIIAIEKDKKLAESLRESFFNDKKLEIMESDALKALPAIIHNSKFIIHRYKIVGNIPYYITGHLLNVISELEPKPTLTVLTLQKEVAERLCAQPPKMNLLSASVQFWAEPEIVDFIPARFFKPRPKVESAIIRLKTKFSESKNAEKYYRLVRMLFKQPRKTVLNNISANGRDKTEIQKLLASAGLNPQERPQNLTLAQIKFLTEKF